MLYSQNSGGGSRKKILRDDKLRERYAGGHTTLLPVLM